MLADLHCLFPSAKPAPLWLPRAGVFFYKYSSSQFIYKHQLAPDCFSHKAVVLLCCNSILALPAHSFQCRSYYRPPSLLLGLLRTHADRPHTESAFLPALLSLNAPRPLLPLLERTRLATSSSSDDAAQELSGRGELLLWT